MAIALIVKNIDTQETHDINRSHAIDTQIHQEWICENFARGLWGPGTGAFQTPPNDHKYDYDPT